MPWRLSSPIAAWLTAGANTWLTQPDRIATRPLRSPIAGKRRLLPTFGQAGGVAGMRRDRAASDRNPNSESSGASHLAGHASHNASRNRAGFGRIFASKARNRRSRAGRR